MTMQYSFPRIAYLQSSDDNYDEFVTNFLKNYMINTDLLVNDIPLDNEYDLFLKIIDNNGTPNQVHNGIAFLFIRDEFTKFEFNNTLLQNEANYLKNEYISNPDNQTTKENIKYLILNKIYTFKIQYKLLQKSINIVNNNFINIENFKNKIIYMNIIDYYIKTMNTLNKEFNQTIHKTLISNIKDDLKDELQKIKATYDISCLPHRLIDNVNLKNLITIEKKNIVYNYKLDNFLQHKLGLNTETYEDVIKDIMLFYEELNNFKKVIINEYSINYLIDCKNNMMCCHYIDKKIEILKKKIELLLDF